MSHEKRRTGVANLVKWRLIVFNVTMVLWMVGGLNASGDFMNSATSDAEVAGTAIGTRIEMMLLTRPQ